MFCYSVRIDTNCSLRSLHALPRATDSRRNHVVCLAILFSCQRTDFRRKGGKIARPSRPCQAECFRSLELIPSDADTRNSLLRRGLKRTSGGAAGTADSMTGPPLCQHRVGNSYNLAPRLAIPTAPLQRVVIVASKISVARDPAQRLAPRLYSVLFRGFPPPPKLHKSLCKLGLLLTFSKIRSRVGTPHNGVRVGAIPRFVGSAFWRTRPAPRAPPDPPKRPRKSSTPGTGQPPRSARAAPGSRETRR